ncbi:Hypp9213 [Branchiostoma lanceolatum]|uniref:Hypp9213 protein n=1 Tax=Branchiostoma lanceolatum TaxID=7740 RepID=A0A8J9ZCL8_BRALA|nr:Hypp9213 [Branchiostoma lanceolatum]
MKSREITILAREHESDVITIYQPLCGEPSSGKDVELWAAVWQGHFPRACQFQPRAFRFSHDHSGLQCEESPGWRLGGQEFPEMQEAKRCLGRYVQLHNASSGFNGGIRSVFRRQIGADDWHGGVWCGLEFIGDGCCGRRPPLSLLPWFTGR